MKAKSFSSSKHLLLDIFVDIAGARIYSLTTTFSYFFVLNDASINLKPIQ